MNDPAYSSLTNSEALSEVRFVYDYVQLIFGLYTLSLYAPLRVLVAGGSFTRNDAGYYDHICSLIGQSLVAIVRNDRVQLEFSFANGTNLITSLLENEAVGPEVAQLSRLGGELMIEDYEH